MKYPSWFPFPTSWLKAILLLIFFRGIHWLLRQSLNDPEAWTTPVEVAPFGDRPESYILVVILMLLSPIALIGTTHYLIHLALNHLYPDVQSPQVKWNLPLMSLWEGIWGWAVVVLALFFVGIVLCLVPGLSEEVMEDQNSANHFVEAIWVIASAWLYQVEYLVQNWSSSKSPAVSNSASQSTTKDLNQLRGKMGLTQMRADKPSGK